MSDSAVTWISVADTAVKIGLAAAISGLFAWLVARHTAKSAITNLLFEQRLERLISAAEQYEAFFQAYLQYTNLLASLVAVSESAEHDDPTGEVYPQMLAQGTTDATKLKMEMLGKMEQTFFAQSTLMMLGDDECCEAAEKLHLAITEATQKIKFDGVTIDLTALPKCHVAISEARKTFYSQMAKVLKKT